MYRVFKIQGDTLEAIDERMVAMRQARHARATVARTARALISLAWAQCTQRGRMRDMVCSQIPVTSLPPTTDAILHSRHDCLHHYNGLCMPLQLTLRKSAQLQAADPAKRRRAKWMRQAIRPNPRIFKRPFRVRF